MKSFTRFAVLAAAFFVAACGSDSSPTCSLDGGQPLGSTDWPKFRADVYNTGQSAADLSAYTGGLEVAWTFTTGGPVLSSPTVGTEREVYIGSSDTKVYRIEMTGPNPSPTPGATWQFATLGTVTTGAAVDDDGVVYVTSNDGNLYTLDPINADQLRTPFGISGVLASPTLGSAPNEGVVYIASLNTGTFAVCPNNILRWTAQVVPVSVVPGLGLDGSVYIAGAAGARTLTSLDPGNAQTNWIFTATAPINAAPVVGPDASVYVVDSSGRAFVLDPIRGTTPQVLYNVNAGVFASPALNAAGTTLYIADQTGTVTAVDIIDPESGTGAARWTYTIPGGAAINSSPALTADGTLLFGADDGKLYGVRDLGETAELRWSFQTGGQVRSSPAVSDTNLDADPPDTRTVHIYVGSSDGKLYALAPQILE